RNLSLPLRLSLPPSLSVRRQQTGGEPSTEASREAEASRERRRPGEHWCGRTDGRTDRDRRKMLGRTLAGALLLCAVQAIDFRHHRYEDMVRTLFSVQNDCPYITRIYSIGRSVEGRHLYVLEFSDNPGIHEPLEPEFKYVGNMHGNEGPEFNGYLTGRGNAREVDLNRNFPDLNALMYYYEKTEGANHHLPLPDNWEEQVRATTSRLVEPETLAVIKWMKNYNFVLSANLHGGAVVANYPFDKSRDARIRGKTSYSATPDDKIFKKLAKTYSYAHSWMHKGWNCGDFFDEGITNGASWYSLSKGMQDFNYLYTNCFEITLELSCDKFPPASALQKEWMGNREALVSYLEQVHHGIKGMVYDENNNPIGNAEISVQGVSHDITSGVDGDYFRLLMPGTYTVTASAPGYQSSTSTVTVGPAEAIQLHFYLKIAPKDGNLNTNLPKKDHRPGRTALRNPGPR
ncbi:hypothetical protein JZ751_025913, partial [Albula glossodonta]